jgi:hypothetical protein
MKNNFKRLYSIKYSICKNPAQRLKHIRQGTGRGAPHLTLDKDRREKVVKVASTTTTTTTTT